MLSPRWLPLQNVHREGIGESMAPGALEKPT